MGTSDSLFFGNATTHGYVSRNRWNEWFSKPFSQDMVWDFIFNEMMPTYPFMNVIKDMSGYWLFQRC